MAAFIKGLSLLVCIFLVSEHVSCQPVDAETIKLNSHNFITRNVEVFKSRQPLPLDSILLNLNTAFKKTNTKEVAFCGYDQDYYWFRFIVNNNSDTAKDLVLVLGPIGIKDAELFQKESGTFKSLGKTGIQYPFNNRPYQYAHFAFPIKLPASITDTFYLSMDFGHEYRSYAFVLMDHKAIKKFENSFYMTYGIIIGLLLLFLILNFYLFFSLKEKIHLWYSLYILFLILIVLVNDELGEQLLGFDSETAYKLTTLSGCGGIAIGILIHVVQLFLINIKPRNIVFKITSLIKYNVLLSAVGHFLAFNIEPGFTIEKAMFYWVNYSTILGIIIIFINCSYSYYWGFKAALPIFIGMSVFFIGSLEKLLLISTASYIFPPSLFHVGILLETTTISFVLFYRNRHERKENLQYVREREKLILNYEKEILGKRLDMQEKTFKNISQEIHDNIGQLLSLVKLNLNNINSQGDNINKKVFESEILLGKAIQDLSDLSTNTQNDLATQTGLIEAIQREVEVMKKTVPHEIELATLGQPFIIPNDKEAVLHRIIQEVLNNIIKHAEASKINININFQESGLAIDIIDDGKGFSLDEIKKNIRKYGLGLRNLESRAEAIGAVLKISSNPGNGTIVSLHLNLKTLNPAHPLNN